MDRTLETLIVLPDARSVMNTDLAGLEGFEVTCGCDEGGLQAGGDGEAQLPGSVVQCLPHERPKNGDCHRRHKADQCDRLKPAWKPSATSQGQCRRWPPCMHPVTSFKS